MNAMHSSGKNTSLLWATALIALINLFTLLGDMPVTRIQEERVAGTAQEMLTRHEYLLPYFHGELRLQKPPLAYWVASAGYTIFGNTGNWALRFFTVCTGLCSLLLLYHWINRETNSNSACFAILCMVSASIPLKISRVAETDPLLMFAIILSVFCAYRIAFAKIHHVWISVVFFAAMGLGMLSKGPPAVAIPAGLLLITAAINKNKTVLPRLFSPTGIVIFLALSFSWYAYVYQQEPDALLRTLTKETDDTYIRGDHNEAVYYYLTRGMGYYAPWSLLIFPCIAWLWQQRQSLPQLVRFACIWFVLVFFILSFNANKQAHYSLLLAPSFSILMGYYLAQATGKHTLAIQLFCAFFSAASCLWIIYSFFKTAVHPQLVFACIASLSLATMTRITLTRRHALIILTAGSVALATHLHTLQPDDKPSAPTNSKTISP